MNILFRSKRIKETYKQERVREKERAGNLRNLIELNLGVHLQICFMHKSKAIDGKKIQVSYPLQLA